MKLKLIEKVKYGWILEYQKDLVEGLFRRERYFVLDPEHKFVFEVEQ